MYCKNCGKEIDDKAVVCPHCGVAVKENALSEIKDDGNLGWGVLGCCFPVIGLILYLIWKDSKPKTAAMAGKGALIAVILLVVYYIFVFALAGAAAF